MQITDTNTETLIPYINNARKHSDEQITMIAASMKEFGFVNPILIDEEKGIIAGHGRLQAAKKLGMDTVPTIKLEHLSKAQKAALVLADNRIAEVGTEWDLELLSLELGSLDELDFNLDLTGFDDSWIIDDTEGLTDDDEVPEIPEEPVSVLGDLWILGNHRLLCGDSTSIDAVEKLMDGQKPNTMVTDPPYGVNLDQSWRDVALGVKALGPGNPNIVDNDDRSDWTDVWSLFEGNVAYVWHANKYTDIVMKSLRDAGLEPSQQIIWNKSVRKNQNHNWKGDRKQTTIWDAAPPNHIMGGSNEEKTNHPTQKPALLYEIAYINHTNPGEYVYEPFGGSGTSIVVGEKISRRSLTMELDERYCDVIVNRWQDYTGKQAVHEDGRLFDEVQHA